MSGPVRHFCCDSGRRLAEIGIGYETYTFGIAQHHIATEINQNRPVLALGQCLRIITNAISLSVDLDPQAMRNSGARRCRCVRSVQSLKGIEGLIVTKNGQLAWLGPFERAKPWCIRQR